MNSSEEGKHIGLAKSENTTGWSNFNSTIEFPSTGDLTMPTIRYFCSHGALLPVSEKKEIKISNFSLGKFNTSNYSTSVHRYVMKMF